MPGAASVAPRTRIVFFDIDGTLRSERTGVVPARTRRAVAALRQRGIRVVVATGRHPLELDRAGLEGMVFDGYAAANGQMCLDGNRQLFAGFPIGAQGSAALVELFMRKELLLWFFGESEQYANRDDEMLARLSNETTGLTPEVRAYDGMTLYQAVAFARVDEEQKLAARLPGCKLQRWGLAGVDIIADDGGKVEGMKAFLERFGCTREESMAFGDQHNDVDMLRFAQIGVAMGNSGDEVSAAADYVTAEVDDEGIVLALEHFGVLEEGWDDGAGEAARQ